MSIYLWRTEGVRWQDILKRPSFLSAIANISCLTPPPSPTQHFLTSRLGGSSKSHVYDYTPTHCMIHESLLHRPTPPAQQPSLNHDCTTLCKQSTYSVSARPTSPGTTLSPRRIMPCPTSPRKTRPDRNGLHVEN